MVSKRQNPCHNRTFLSGKTTSVSPLLSDIGEDAAWRPMRMLLWIGIVIGWTAVSWGASPGASGRVTLATYNIENYILAPVGSRPAKSEASKSKVASILKTIGADIVGLQEVGGTNALADLCRRTAALGLPYEHREWVQGFDTNIQVALISRYPIVARRPHTRDSYLLSGRRFQVSRGILEVDVRVRGDEVLTVFVAHLKSRRAAVEADEGEMRREEARILRDKVEARMRAAPRSKVVVLGDLNDTKDSVAIRALLGRGKEGWVDARPSERNGDTGYTPNARWQPRTVAWTHYYGVEDTYSRVDYVLLHRNAARDLRPAESYVPVVSDWGLASDHRPVVVVLETGGR
jgi:endonuclease/exonuclease/phosphatase family metal-dependent hydrolase